MSGPRNGIHESLSSAHNPRWDREATPWGRRIAAEDAQRRAELAHVMRRMLAPYEASPAEKRRREDAVQRMCEANRARKASDR